MPTPPSSRESFNMSSEYNREWNPHYDFNNPANQAEIKTMSRYDRDFETVYGEDADPDSPEYKEAKAFLVQQEIKNTGGKEGYEIGLEIKKDWGLNKVIGINEADQTCIKEITVWPNCMLSLQSHLGREEAWQVRRGILTLIMDDKLYEVSHRGVFDVTNGDRAQITDSAMARRDSDHGFWSIILPKNSIHCMINRHDEDVVVIETQAGITLEADNRRYIDQVRNLPKEKQRAILPLPTELHYKAARLYWGVEAEIAEKARKMDPNWNVSYNPTMKIA